MKKSTAILLVTALAGCTPPPLQITQQQVASFSNEELCNIKQNYQPNAMIEAEIGKRHLICDPAINECLGRGNRLGTPAMALCVQDLREKWSMQQQLQQKDQQLQQQQVEQTNLQLWNSILQATPKQQVIKNGNSTIIQQY